MKLKENRCLRRARHTHPSYYPTSIPYEPVNFATINGNGNTKPLQKSKLNGKSINGFRQNADSKDIKNDKEIPIQNHVDQPISEKKEYTGYSCIEGVITFEQLRSMEIPDSLFLIENIVVAGVLNVLAGESDCGKSMLAVQIGLNICCKSVNFLGYKINAIFNRVIYVSTEDGEIQLSWRAKKQNKGFTYGKDLYHNFGFIVARKNIVQLLDPILKKLPADLIIIDNFHDVYIGDLNSAIEVRKFFNDLQDLIDKYKCAILIISHLTKARRRGSATKTDILGSQAVEAKPRHVLLLSKVSNNPEYLTLRLDKSNYVDEATKKQIINLKLNSQDLIFEKVDDKDIAKTKPLYVVKLDRKSKKAAQTERKMKRAYELIVNERLSYRDVGKELGVDHTKVFRWIKKMKGE